jgi:hypothetical protein
MSKSIPWFVYPISIGLVVLTSFAIMIYSWVDDSFDNFYGFSITYLVINILLFFYAIYLIYNDQENRMDRPNFFSPYGSPVFKYDPNISSATYNRVSLLMWLLVWFIYYSYTILMQIFIADTNIGVSAGTIFQVVIFLTFIYFTTYNAYKAGKIKS